MLAPEWLQHAVCVGKTMPKSVTLSLYFFAAFVQAGTYGLTFLLPKLFASFGADEKDVGAMLIVTTAVDDEDTARLQDTEGLAEKCRYVREISIVADIEMVEDLITNDTVVEAVRRR